MTVAGELPFSRRAVAVSYLQQDGEPYPEGNDVGEATMKCAACGHENTDDALFCGHCGAPLNANEQDPEKARQAAAQPAVAKAAQSDGRAPEAGEGASDAAPIDRASTRQAGESADESQVDATVVSPAARVATNAESAAAPGAAAVTPRVSPSIASPAPVNPAAEARAHASRRKRGGAALAIAGVIIVLALMAIGAMSFMSWQREVTQKAALDKPYPIPVTINAEGLNTDAGTRVPVKAVGTTANGEQVDTTFYARQGDKSGIELAQGTYTLTIPASPIASDGTLYDVSAAQAQITVGSDGLAEGPAFNLPVIEPVKITDEQIEQAYQAAKAGGANNEQAAEDLKTLATKRRDDAVAAQKAAEEAQKQAEERAAARHVTAQSYELDIPEFWLDKVSVQVSGDTVTIYSKRYPTRVICEIQVVDSQTAVAGDVSSSQIGSLIPLGTDGTQVIQVWATRWGVVAADNAKLAESGTTIPDAPSEEEADVLVNIQTGGSMTYTDDPTAFDTTDGTPAGVTATDNYLQQNVNATIKVK